MKFSVIIPTYNDWNRLEKCIEKLIEAKEEYDVSCEIIVVDNAAIHNPPEKFKNMNGIRLVHEETPGSYAARNKGAVIATGYYLAFTDSDCIPGKFWLLNADKVFQEKECDLIGGRIDLFRDEKTGNWAYIYESHTAFSQSKNVPKGHCVTANLLIKRTVFEKLGGFNSEIKSGGDWEFSGRAVSSGYKLCYADDVMVFHPARKTLRAIFKKQKRFAAWSYLNVQRDYGHSGLRILLSNAYHGFGSVFSRGNIPDTMYEKIVVFTISAGIYVYKTFLQICIISGLTDPGKIRE